MKINDSVTTLRDLSQYISLCFDTEADARKSHMFAVGDENTVIKCCKADTFLGSPSLLVDYTDLSDSSADTCALVFGVSYTPKLPDMNEESLTWFVNTSFPSIISDSIIISRAHGTISIENGFEVKTMAARFSQKCTQAVNARFVPFTETDDPSIKKHMEETIKIYKKVAESLCEYFNDILEKHADYCRVIKRNDADCDSYITCF